MSSDNEKEEANLIATFQQACASLKKKVEVNCDVLLEKAEDILCKTDSSLGLRRSAAEFLHRCQCGHRNWLGLAAALDVDGPNFLVALARRWLDLYELVSNIASSADEFIFYSRFIVKISKEREIVREKLGDSVFVELKKNLTFAALKISELRDENCTSILKALVKLNKNEEEIQQMAVICQEISIYIPENLLLASLLSKESNSQLPLLDAWMPFLPILASENEIACASSPLVAEFLRHEPFATIETIVTLLLSRNITIVGNVLRTWIHRWQKEQQGLVYLRLIIIEIEKRCKTHFNLPKKKYWPPDLEYFEDLTCIDPQWNWEESSGVTWPEDRLLNAFLDTWQTLYEKFALKKAKEICLSPDNHYLQFTSKWHEERIRLKARNLLKLLGGPVTISPKRVNLEAGTKVYVPDDLEVPQIPVEPIKLEEFVEKMLKCHGSERKGQVPAFPTVHIRFKELGMNERVFVKQITDSIDFVLSSNEMDNAEKAKFIFIIVVRTRIKAIVESGCRGLETLFEKDPSLIDCYFPQLTDYLFGEKTEIRTLALSRMLWSCCQHSGEKLFVNFWKLLEPKLSLSTNSTVLTRILKSLKHFVSQADCKFPSSSDPALFSFCLEAQNSREFLTRSAATIVFGFLVKRIAASRKLPLFVLIAGQNGLWRQWRTKLHNFSTLPKTQRILLLTLMRKYIIVHLEFYSDYELKTIYHLLYQLNVLREKSPDVRERRFCIDVLVQLTPPNKHSDLQELMSEGDSLNNLEDVNYLHYRLNCLKIQVEDKEHPLTAGQVEKIAGSSEYCKIQRRLEVEDKNIALETIKKLSTRTNMENELASQNLAIALETVVWNHGDSFPEFEEIYSKLKKHEFDRVRSLASRILVASRKEDYYKNTDTT